MRTVIVSASHCIAIPVELRQRLNIEPGSKLFDFEQDGAICFSPAPAPHVMRGIARGIDPRIDDEPDRSV